MLNFENKKLEKNHSRGGRAILSWQEGRRVKENLHPLVNVARNITSKYEEKTEVFTAYFAYVFNSKK